MTCDLQSAVKFHGDIHTMEAANMYHKHPVDVTTIQKEIAQVLTFPRNYGSRPINLSYLESLLVSQKEGYRTIEDFETFLLKGLE